MCAAWKASVGMTECANIFVTCCLLVTMLNEHIKLTALLWIQNPNLNLTLKLLSWIMKLNYCIENQHIWVNGSVHEEFVQSNKLNPAELI